MKQNITLSLDAGLLREAKILAAKRNTSVSRLLADELEERIQRDQAYELAKRAALAQLDNAKLDLGGTPIPREELYRQWPGSGRE